ncbi:hypothetical protein [Streptomyces sp. NPDC045251]|uniref:hypothetical protein n=1 Tax=unclassified Streptomyces TaxID=2593676 RepID=UPI0033C82716
MNGINSCTARTLTRAADGNNRQVNTDIRNTEFVYSAGGDQCRYADWKGTAPEASVESVVTKGDGAGGGSAGHHVSSPVVHDACGDSATVVNDSRFREGGSLCNDAGDLATRCRANTYVALGDHRPARTVAGRPLTFTDYKIRRLAPGTAFDFADRPTCGYYRRSVIDGSPTPTCTPEN